MSFRFVGADNRAGGIDVPRRVTRCGDGAHRTRAVLCALLMVTSVAAAFPAAAQTGTPGGVGYGRHALMPPRHDLRPPPLGPDGALVTAPDVELGEVPPDRSLPSGPQSTVARHVNWCRTRHRSYDARTDTVPRAGAGRVPCASPFRER